MIRLRIIAAMVAILLLAMAAALLSTPCDDAGSALWRVTCE